MPVKVARVCRTPAPVRTHTPAHTQKRAYPSLPHHARPPTHKYIPLAPLRHPTHLHALLRSSLVLQHAREHFGGSAPVGSHCLLQLGDGGGALPCQRLRCRGGDARQHLQGWVLRIARLHTQAGSVSVRPSAMAGMELDSMSPSLVQWHEVHRSRGRIDDCSSSRTYPHRQKDVHACRHTRTYAHTRMCAPPDPTTHVCVRARTHRRGGGEQLFSPTLP